MDNTRGIVLMVLGMLGFAAEDMFIKLASAGLPVGEILAILGIPSAILFAVLARARGDNPFSRDFLHPAVLIRNVSEMFGSVGFVMSLALIPLATAITILQATPLFVTMGAALVLREAVGWRRWTAILVGFLGVVLVIRPGLSGFDPNVIWAVIGVIGLSIRDLASRKVPKAISSLQLAVWGFSAVGIVGLLMITITGGAKMPTGSESLYLLGAFIIGSIAYWTLTEATRVGEIAVVTPFRYSRLVFTTIVGAIVFYEYPDTYTLVGATIIIATGLYTLMRERKRRRQEAVRAKAEAAASGIY
ncbi:DMT family transporter [Hoeflea sp.]|uniref:DMT family transporter n=1 Tax=Hoeflea sp. TaxID=1940281 RepID=UPI003A917EC9